MGFLFSFFFPLVYYFYHFVHVCRCCVGLGLSGLGLLVSGGGSFILSLLPSASAVMEFFSSISGILAGGCGGLQLGRIGKGISGGVFFFSSQKSLQKR